MAHHEHGHNHEHLPASEARALAAHAWPIYSAAFLAGVAGLILALLAAFFSDRGWARFGHAYVVSYAFFLSLSLGSLCFVLLQHLTRAGWSVLVRRPAEVLAANMPILAILFAPILLLVVINDGQLYPWAQSIEGAHGHEASHAVLDPTPGENGALIHRVANAAPAVEADPAHGAHGPDEHLPAHDEAHAGTLDAETLHAIEGKRGYLNAPFFIIRWVLYLAIWSGLGLWYWRQSTMQDETGDDRLTIKMEHLSAPATLLFALTITFAAFDLLMSLEPRWYSTIFGVYYFAGAFLGCIATLILVLLGLQRLGYCQSVSTEHYHDLGKLLFAFVFFWGYIAFSQYMLIWYGNLPEETFWYDIHGFTTVTGAMTPWTVVGLVLLFGHLLIPFVALLSRHAKRNRAFLAFWAVWLLVLHWVDLYWVVMPQFDASSLPVGLVELGCLIGIGGVFVGGAVRLAANHSLIPVKDPRLAESLGHETV